MNTPFYPPLSIEKLRSYLDGICPEKLIVETNTWDCDPTDLLAIADLISEQIQKEEYAIALYRHALKQLENNTNLIAQDTNLQGAYANLGASLIRLNRHEEAINPLKIADNLNKNDPTVKFNLALSYFKQNFIVDAHKCINSLFQIPNNILYERWSSQNIALAKQLYNLLNDVNGIVQTLANLSSENHSAANKYYSNQQYNEAIQKYKKAINYYTEILNIDKSIEELPMKLKDIIKGNLARAFLDKGSCHLEVKGVPINIAIIYFIKALLLVPDLNDAKKNLLYSMNFVNSFLKTKSLSTTLSSKKQYIDLHNQGYDLLKTPLSTNPSERRWDEAIDKLTAAIEIESNQAFTYHLLGLAYEGKKMDEKAIESWIKVYNIDKNFNFEERVVFKL